MERKIDGDPTRDQQITFAEKMSDTLFGIYSQLENLRIITHETLDDTKIDNICDLLRGIRDEAERTGNTAMTQLLEKLGIQFYVLCTKGVVDQPEKFAYEAEHAFDLLETTLLATDNQVPKNQGRIVEAITSRQD